MARTVFNTNAEVKKVLRFTDTPCHHEKEQAEAYEHLHPSRWNIANNVNVCIVSILGIVALAVFIKWYYSSLIGADVHIYATSLTFGFVVSLFTWMIIYMDSNIPGIRPPSPFSPRRYREITGHSYHLNYVMSFMNGIAVVVLSVWWQKSY